MSSISQTFPHGGQGVPPIALETACFVSDPRRRSTRPASTTMSGRAHSSMLRPRSGTASSEAIDDRQRLFGRRASAPAPSVEVEAMEAANHAAVEGLAGQVGTMRHVSFLHFSFCLARPRR